jgi:hypothetical protein
VLFNHLQWWVSAEVVTKQKLQLPIDEQLISFCGPEKECVSPF